jgi:putative membrane protein
MKMMKEEFKKLFQNKILFISVIAITFIPILYSSIFDKSVWDPYGNAKNLPVAVVNLDKSTKVMGQKVDIGSQVVDNLKKNHDLDWHFVTEKEAEKGLKDLEYYMVVTITDDFSENAASIINHKPKKMEIIYTTNESLNYIAIEISQVAATSLEDQVRDQVVTAYTTAVTEGAKKLVSGLAQAQSGTNQLADGTKQLDSGLDQYTQGVSQADGGSKQLSQGLTQLNGSVPALQSGVSKLDTGSKELCSSINQVNNSLNPIRNNVSTIDGALESLAVGTKSLETGLIEFENELNPQVAADMRASLGQIEAKVENLLANKDQLYHFSDQANGVANQVDSVSQKFNNASINITRVESDMNGYVAELLGSVEMPEDQKASIAVAVSSHTEALLDSQLETSKSEIDQTLSGLSQDMATLSSLSHEVANASGDVSNVAGAVAASAGEINNSVNAISGGVEQLDSLMSKVPHASNATTLSNDLAYLSNDFSLMSRDLPVVLNGMNQLASGSNQLSNGLDQLASQVPTLASGVSQLSSGSDQLESGLNELNSKSPELMSGISALEDGAVELANAVTEGVNKSSTVKITKKNIDQFANPTKLTNKEYSKVENYGVALAPYIMSLALFVGTMLFNFVYPIRKVSLLDQESDSWWFSKVTLGFTVSSAMAFIQASVMLLIGLKVDNIPLFYITAFVTAWSYMAIVMFLAMTFDNPGRFVAMVLLVLQLGGAGGTFPVQIQSSFFKVIHPYLPMSYSVYAFREAISGGIGSILYNHSINILLFLFILFVVLLRLSMSILQNNHLEGVSRLNDNQKLQALIK